MVGGPVADGWREIGWFDEATARAAARSHGELWFVGGNYRGMLDQVRRRADDTPACIGVGPHEPEEGGAVRAALLAMVGTAVGLVNPLLELVLLAGDAGRTAVAAHSGDGGTARAGDIFGLVDELVRDVAGQDETVVLVIDAADADSDRWHRLFAQVTARWGRLRSQRLVVVMGVPDCPSDITSGSDGVFPEMVQMVAGLVSDRRAEWLWVPPLTATQVTGRLRVSEQTAQLLVTVTDGDDRLASARLSGWIDARVLRPQPDGTWVLRDAVEDHVLVGIERHVDRLCGDDPATAEQAYVALGIAAVSADDDQSFCGETVARVAETEGHDYDTIIDVLDTLTADGSGPPLLRSTGWMPNQPGREPPHLWRYVVVDPAVTAYFRGQVRGDERTRLSGLLLDQLVRLHLDHSTFDVAIGRLAREAGNERVARLVESRRATAEAIAHAPTEAAVLLAIAATWDVTDPYLCEVLCDVTARLIDLGITSTAIETGQVALTLARASATTPELLLCDALYELGWAHHSSGEVELAIPILDDARVRLQQLYQDTPTTELALRLGRTLYGLGWSYVDNRQAAVAEPLLVEALRLNKLRYQESRSAASLNDLALTVHELGCAYMYQQKLDLAEETFTTALTYKQALLEATTTPRQTHSIVLTLIALARVLRDQGNREAAIARLRLALDLAASVYAGEPTPAYRRSLSTVLSDLGLIAASGGLISEALSLLREACSHDEELHRQHPSPETLRTRNKTRRDLAAVEQDVRGG